MVEEEDIKKNIELNFLLNQSNKHFIYNALNMLFSKTSNISPFVANKILNLSNHIRKIVGSN